MIKHIRHWGIDYLHMLRGHARVFLYLRPPRHYLGHIVRGKEPIILIPGVVEKWHFLKEFADPLSLQGHPVYVIRKLGYNVKDIPRSGELISELIQEKNLKDVIIIAHSKGGLIGKHIFAFHNEKGEIKKLIAIATPFGGSRIARMLPGRHFKELLPESKTITLLHGEKDANRHIVSVFGTFDNHIWPQESARLEGAKNIQVDTYGHHRILFDKKVRDIVLREVKEK